MQQKLVRNPKMAEQEQRKPRNTLRKKLKNCHGVTLVEMLATVVVLVLLGMMLQTGLNLAVHSYHKMMATSEIEVLASTISSVMADELRYAKDVRLDDEGQLYSYTSANYGTKTIMTKNDEGQLISSSVPVGGTDTSTGRMLATGAYGNGDYKITGLTITCTPTANTDNTNAGNSSDTDTDNTNASTNPNATDTPVFYVTLKLTCEKYDVTEETTFVVRCLNP
jgi:competence protein ComGC